MDETENDSGTTSEPTDATTDATPELDIPAEVKEEDTDAQDADDDVDDDVDEAPAKSRTSGGLVAGILVLVLLLVAATVGVLLLKRDNGPYKLKGSITLGAIQQGQPCTGPIPGGVTVAMIGSDGKTAGSALAGDLTTVGTNCTTPFAFEITKSDTYQMEIQNPKDPSQSLPGPKYALQELKDKNFNLVVDGNAFAPTAPPPTAPPGAPPAPPAPKTPSSAPAS